VAEQVATREKSNVEKSTVKQFCLIEVPSDFIKDHQWQGKVWGKQRTGHEPRAHHQMVRVKSEDLFKRNAHFRKKNPTF